MPSVVLALIAVGLGVWTVREGEARLGWGAVAAGVIGAVGAIAATQSGEANLERVVVWSALAAAMLRFATPLVFGALGGVISERSGVVNIGLEGMMLMGAFFAIFGADVLGGWIPGLLLGMAAGGALALIHAFFAVSLRADQIVSGFAVNFLALGVTGYVFLDHYGERGHARRRARCSRRHPPDRLDPVLRAGAGEAQPARLGRAHPRAAGVDLPVPHADGPARCGRSARTRARRRPSASRSTGSATSP